jgi:hypothetical protein
MTMNWTPRRRLAGPDRVKLTLQLDGDDWPVQTREAMARLAMALHVFAGGGSFICRFVSDWVHVTTPRRDEVRVTQAWEAAVTGDDAPATALAQEYEELEELYVLLYPRVTERRVRKREWLRDYERAEGV